jgi:hypothetical protein
MFDGLATGVGLNEDLIEFECERVAALADPPGDPPVTANEYRRAGLRELEKLRQLPPGPELRSAPWRGTCGDRLATVAGRGVMNADGLDRFEAVLRQQARVAHERSATAPEGDAAERATLAGDVLIRAADEFRGTLPPDQLKMDRRTERERDAGPRRHAGSCPDSSSQACARRSSGRGPRGDSKTEASRRRGGSAASGSSSFVLPTRSPSHTCTSSAYRLTASPPGVGSVEPVDLLDLPERDREFTSKVVQRQA